jgi:HEAT repeat protein
MSTEDERVLSSVVIALRQTRSRDALLPLSDLLNNEQQTVRYYAVAGMGEITVQDRWTPTFPEFLKNEAKYLNYWRDWAASNLPQRPNQPPHDLRP